MPLIQRTEHTFVSMRWMCVLLAVCIAASVSTGQTIEIPQDDQERHEALVVFLDDLAAAIDQASSGEYEEAIESLLAMYDGAVWLHPQAGARVADRLGVYYARIGEGDRAVEWLSRSLELGDEGGVGDLTRGRLAYELEKQGKYEQAARVALASNAAGPDRRLGWTTLYEAANNLVRAGFHEEAVEAYALAEEAIAETDRPADQQFDIRFRSILDAQRIDLHDPDPVSLRVLVDTYRDPAFVDVPLRLSQIGAFTVEMAHHLGEYGVAEAIGLDVLRECARLETRLGRAKANKKLVPQGYIHTAIELAYAYEEQGRDLEALELLESAVVTYPENALSSGDLVLGRVRSIRQRLDMMPFDEEQIGGERFGVVGGLPEPDPLWRQHEHEAGADADPLRESSERPSRRTGIANRQNTPAPAGASHLRVAWWAGAGIVALIALLILRRLRPR